jgi:two-component system, LytTR family, sensor kinase
MDFANRKVSSDLLFRFLFHIIFWFFWLILPLLASNLDGDTKRFEFLLKILPLNIFCVPFFYFNSEILINKFLPKGNITGYISSLLALFLVFLSSSFLIKNYLVTEYNVRIYDSRTLFPVLFIISMSTLYGFIIFMIRQTKRNQELQAERLMAELSFLRSQISPHFIFNVLNSIVYLIRSRSPKAESVTLELSELIRYMLYDSEHKQVPLENEIQYLRNYVELQKIRFGEDVAIDLQIEGHFEGCMIEPMLLIPFVENAFKHGVGYLKKPTIGINIRCQHQTLKCHIQNQIGPETNEQKDIHSGIGLKNVKRRIDLLYPETNKLIVEQKEDTFFVDLTLELKKM